MHGKTRLRCVKSAVLLLAVHISGMSRLDNPVMLNTEYMTYRLPEFEFREI